MTTIWHVVILLLAGYVLGAALNTPPVFNGLLFAILVIFAGLYVTVKFIKYIWRD